MNYRRIPFQFTTTDPLERQRELERRFGLPPSNNMYVDGNPPSVVTENKDLHSSSPRLQHRVPIFVEGSDQPIKKTSVDSTNMYPEKKSNIRIVPIEVEGVNSQPSRHRTFSGPAGLVKKNESILGKDGSPVKHSLQNLSKSSKVKTTTEPRIHNIPIQIEGRGFSKSPKSETVVKPLVEDHPTVNGYNISKPENKSKSSEKKEIEPAYNIPLKKIENVLHELETYESGMQEFNGTRKDKQYRYLDEMLTRCMLRLDDIDTMGNENVRFARKSAVKKVQACIDLLETKVKPQTDVIINRTEDEANVNELNKDIDMNEIIHIGSVPVEVVHNEVSENQCSNNEFVQASSEIEMAEIKEDDMQCEGKSQTQNVNAIGIEIADKENAENEQLPLVVKNTQVDIDVKDQNIKEKINENEPSLENADVFDVEMTSGKETENELLSSNSEKTEVQMKENAIVSVSSHITQSQIATVVDEKQNNFKCEPQMKINDVEMKDIDDDQKKPCLNNSGDSKEVYKENVEVLNFNITEKETNKTSNEHSESKEKPKIPLETVNSLGLTI